MLPYTVVPRLRNHLCRLFQLKKNSIGNTAVGTFIYKLVFILTQYINAR